MPYKKLHQKPLAFSGAVFVVVVVIVLVIVGRAAFYMPPQIDRLVPLSIGGM